MSLLYRILDLIINFVSRLPLSILYFLSGVVYLTMKYIIRYRADIIRGNLRDTFPQINGKELKRLESQYYRHLSHLVVEIIKLHSISKSEISRRMAFHGTEIIDNYLRQGRPVVVYFSHVGNWEWASSFPIHSSLEQDANMRFCQVYRPLRNEWFDRWFLNIRSRFGALSFAKKVVFRDLLRLNREKKVWVTGFMSDQKPSHGDPTLVASIADRPTHMITGTETLARKFKAAVVYWDMSQTSRGHYTVDVVQMTDDASLLAEGELTRMYARLLSDTIERNPAIWLWSHNRWNIK